jgi:erythromycin esterase
MFGKRFFTKFSLFTLLLAILSGCTTIDQISPEPTPSKPTAKSIDITETISPTETPVQNKPSGPRATAQAQASEITFVTPPPPPLVLPQEFEPWIQDRSHEINSLTSEEFSDLQFLEPLLEGKRIVQLGEDNHSTREQSLMKVRLIKYLHQELGYEVIAFESGLLDCYLAYQQIEKLSPQSSMEHCIFSIWHTEEVLPLFEYVTSVSHSSSPLILAGVDIQQGKFDTAPGFYFQLIKVIDNNYAKDIKNLENVFYEPSNKSDLYKALAEVTDDQNPIIMYDELAMFFDTHSEKINHSFPNYHMPAAAARQGAWSRARFIEQTESRSIKWKSFNIRDHGMARNVQFLAEELYPDKKIILWAHNKHISEAKSIIEWTNMGAHLEKYYGDSLYSIGLFGYRPMSSRETLISKLYSYGIPYLFLDLANNKAVDQELFQPKLSTYEFPADKYFDALIFFDHVTPPHKLSGNSGN